MKLKNLFIWPEEKPNVPNNLHHWFGNENAVVLERLIDEINPKYILEMGSWTGAGSTQFILKKAVNCHLVCVDHWSKDLEDYVQKDFQIEKVKNQIGEFIPTLWETFLVNNWENRERITPIRKKTVDALQFLKTSNIPFDLIYIDAHHDYESVLHDITIAGEIWPNAVICGDDYLWPDGGVAKAVNEYAEANNLITNVSEQCWFYTKK